MGYTQKVIVIGAGISGLACAYRLKQLRIACLVLEAQEHAGCARFILRGCRLHPAPFSPGGLIGTRLMGLRSKLRILTEAFGFSRPPLNEETLAEFVQRKFGTEVLDYLVDPLISTVFFGDAGKMGMDSAFPVLVEWERNHGSLVRGALRARNSRRQLPSADVSPQQARTGNVGTLRVTDALPSLGSLRSGMAALPERLASELPTT